MAASLRGQDQDVVAESMRPPELSIISPSFNERPNIRPFIAAVSAALNGVEWELIIVDDDSPDGTYQEILEVTKVNPRVRGLRRVGRKGLSSAVIEGILASSAPVVAVIDADLQHDEKILPTMLSEIRKGADIVVGTRYAAGGGVGSWSEDRARMSRFATKISQFLIGGKTTDPMSGFFLARRQLVNNCVYDLSQQGYKILLDLLASAPKSICVAEVPYVFRERQAGESKISIMVLAEFLFLIIEKITNGLIPPRFVLFAIVGILGLVVHLTALNLTGSLGVSFVNSQIAATFFAMLFNFAFNNQFTFRDRRLVGTQWAVGLVLFILICAIGAIANVSVANLAKQEFGSWNLAGLMGAFMGSVFNFGVASSIVWNRRPRSRVPDLSS